MLGRESVQKYIFKQKVIDLYTTWIMYLSNALINLEGKKIDKKIKASIEFTYDTLLYMCHILNDKLGIELSADVYNAIESVGYVIIHFNTRAEKEIFQIKAVGDVTEPPWLDKTGGSGSGGASRDAEGEAARGGGASESSGNEVINRMRVLGDPANIGQEISLQSEMPPEEFQRTNLAYLGLLTVQFIERETHFKPRKEEGSDLIYQFLVFLFHYGIHEEICSEIPETLAAQREMLEKKLQKLGIPYPERVDELPTMDYPEKMTEGETTEAPRPAGAPPISEDTHIEEGTESPRPASRSPVTEEHSATPSPTISPSPTPSYGANNVLGAQFGSNFPGYLGSWE